MDSTKEMRYWIALKRVEGLGNIGIRSLLKVFSSPEAIFQASRNSLNAVPGIGQTTSGNIQSFSGWSQIENELDMVSHRNINIITCQDPLFPPMLQMIYDAPVLLYVKGTLNPGDITLAMVGSRRASPYGKFTTEKLARELSLRGITVVSGMARGIDSSAHRGALTAGGRSIAVLGSGLDVIYPPENKDLYQAIAENGAVVSEYPLGTPPNAPNFPARNRIISGMSLGVVVVEASDKSGSLITARIALEQGREVFAIPGSIDAPGSRGTHKLIKEGAALAESSDDILSVILPQVGHYIADHQQKAEKPAAATTIEPVEETENTSHQADLTEKETIVYHAMGDTPIHIDTIIQTSHLKTVEVIQILLSLELQGVISQMPGKMYLRKEGTVCHTH